jgi:hypothetical protein
LFFGPATPVASSGALVYVSHEASRFLSLQLLGNLSVMIKLGIKGEQLVLAEMIPVYSCKSDVFRKNFERKRNPKRLSSEVYSPR